MEIIKIEQNPQSKYNQHLEDIKLDKKLKRKNK